MKTFETCIMALDAGQEIDLSISGLGKVDFMFIKFSPKQARDQLDFAKYDDWMKDVQKLLTHVGVMVLVGNSLGSLVNPFSEKFYLSDLCSDQDSCDQNTQNVWESVIPASERYSPEMDSEQEERHRNYWEVYRKDVTLNYPGFYVKRRYIATLEDVAARIHNPEKVVRCHVS